MSDFNNLMEMIQSTENVSVIQSVEEQIQSNNLQKSSFEIIKNNDYTLFDISKFTKELQQTSEDKNRLYRDQSQFVNAYDLSKNCIGDIIYKLTNTPVESFADKWLPILLRSMLGNAVHSFIQDNTTQFSEKEVSLKIPSIRFSGRLDALSGNNILIEIKSMTYSDYEKVIKTRKPRIADFYQAIVYKYILENHLKEAKNPGTQTRTQVPCLDNYNIDKLQFIYVAHDITATDVESFGEIVQRIKDLKKVLNSKSNTFFFITTLVIDLNDEIVKPYIQYIINKLKRINWYLDNNKFPNKDDEFIDKTACYFCLYKKICNL